MQSMIMIRVEISCEQSEPIAVFRDSRFAMQAMCMTMKQSCIIYRRVTIDASSRVIQNRAMKTIR
ncbi:hypothetical protein ACH0B6_17585 [Solibacillus silvestris]